MKKIIMLLNFLKLFKHSFQIHIAFKKHSGITVYAAGKMYSVKSKYVF